MPPTVPLASVPLDQVQGIILRGYELLEEATFVLLKIQDVAAAKQWLAGLVESNQIADAKKKPGDPKNPNSPKAAVNVAFTWSGLLRLLQKEIHPEELQGFSREFQEGMVTPHRQRILGDSGESAPEKWTWGNREENTPDVLLMLYALDPTQLQNLVAIQKTAYLNGKLQEIQVLETADLVGRKEQFGFRDGIAQPFIEGVHKEPPTTETEAPVPGNTLKAGEVLLGYDNEYEKSPVRPLVQKAGTDSYLDFGSNGSYLVLRQLRQDVHAFWKYLYEATGGPSLSAAPVNARQVQLAVKLAARMVGRWPSGAPLMNASDKDDLSLLNDDEYGYDSDSAGIKCPIGSHTRRANPRDSLEPGAGAGRLTAEESLRVTRRHRIIRRGRPYGKPVDSSMDPVKMVEVIAASPDISDTVDRGLLFLCFNADIARQFEFIQQTWINNPKFGGLYEDNDPIMGQRFLPQVSPKFKVTAPSLNALAKKGLPDAVQTKLVSLLDQEFPNQEEFLAALAPILTVSELTQWQALLVHYIRISSSDTFTWQDIPIRHRFTKLPDFVTVRGGGYFFMPGMDAIRFLAGKQDALRKVSLSVSQ